MKFTNFENRQCLFFQCFTAGARLASYTTRGMLRIHRDAKRDLVFTLSGRIEKENIPELEAVIGAEGGNRRITLDLKDMILTGQDGIDFLAQCEAADIALANCDPYVREWITRLKNGT